jgi:hypothetical protein
MAVLIKEHGIKCISSGILFQKHVGFYELTKEYSEGIARFIGFLRLVKERKTAENDLATRGRFRYDALLANTKLFSLVFLGTGDLQIIESSASIVRVIIAMTVIQENNHLVLLLILLVLNES